VRTQAAAALADWLATDPTGQGAGRELILGDLNSYSQEDPMQVLHAAGYTDVVGPDSYTYVFDGQLGSLDHALAGPAIRGEVTDAAVWNVNADEPSLIDYDMTFKLPAQDALYAPDAYRSSDHDPVVVGLDLEKPDRTKPTATIKEGASFTVRTGDTFDRISYKLYDAGKIDKVTLNGVVKDLTDNTWSDVNFIRPGVFGGVKGLNTLVVHDVAGNTQTYTFTLN
jgi:Predicted extracellular nuclease